MLNNVSNTTTNEFFTAKKESHCQNYIVTNCRTKEHSRWRYKIPVMLNEAKTSRPRPKLRGRGQDYEVEAEAKNDYEKVRNND